MRYGTLCGIEEQYNEVGYGLGGKKKLINKLYVGLNRCHSHGILSDREYDMALKRLNKMAGECAVRLDEVTE